MLNPWLYKIETSEKKICPVPCDGEFHDFFELKFSPDDMVDSLKRQGMNNFILHCKNIETECEKRYAVKEGQVLID